MAKDFQNQNVVTHYDEHIRKLIPGYELVHQQIDAILSTFLCESAHVLVVGCGTGYELQYLLQKHNSWHFTAVDTSSTMLEQAQQNLKTYQERITFIHGDAKQLAETEQFDAALAILVGHFVPFKEKLEFYRSIYSRLKENTIFITYDLMFQDHAYTLHIMQHLAEQIGLQKHQSQKMIERIQQDFQLVSIEDYRGCLESVGFNTSEIFCQIINYYGFLIQKHHSLKSKNIHD